MSSVFEVSTDDRPLNGTASPPGHKRILRGTDQQEQLWSALVAGQSHLLVEARAGCGKSSSCREGMFRMLDGDRRLRIRYAVFNSANAQEFRADCPPGVDVGTIHSFGNRALYQAISCRIDKNKTYLILDHVGAQFQPRWMRKATATLVSLAKNQMYRPDDGDLVQKLADLVTYFGIEVYHALDTIVGLASRAFKRSAEWTDLIDFDDMLWLPVLLGCSFPACDVLFVDECQDLNPAQHALLPLICPAGRIVSVGDRFQAIYAFRGADSDSIPNLTRILGGGAGVAGCGLGTLPLTVTFRCPQSHIRLARELVPDIEAHASNAEGQIDIDHPLSKALEEAKPGDMFICPTNAPIVSAALRLIGQKRRALVKGRALGDQLLQVIRGLKGVRTIGDLCWKISEWRGKELERLRQREGVEDLMQQTDDRADSLLALAEACESPAELPGLIGTLFVEDVHGASAVMFSTVHRAKGLEASTVFFLDTPPREPRTEWEARQQQNLRYVALTRSKHRLAFVVPDDPK